MPLDERSKRRADFAPEPLSEPVVMRDGQTWYVAKPMVRLMPSDDVLGYERVTSFGVKEFDDRLDRIMRAIDRATESDGIDPETGRAWTGLHFDLYRCMFDRNYNLTTDEFREIFWVELGAGGDADPLASQLSDLARGLSGKGRSGGGDALSASLAD